MGWQDDKPVASGSDFWAKDKPAAQDSGTDLSHVPGFLGESARKLIGSTVETAGGMNEFVRKNNPLNRILEMIMPKGVQAVRDQVESAAKQIDVPSVKDENGNTPMWDRALRGAGASLAVPIPGAGLIPMGVSGAMGGMGAEGGGRLAEKLSSGLRPYGEMAGGALGGIAGGLATGPRIPVAQQDLHRALRGTTPEQFTQAQRNATNAASSGAKTATAAEMFDPNSPIMALAAKVRGGTLDNALRQKTQGRAEDLEVLGQTFLNRVGPEVNPNEVANRTAARASEVLKGHRDQAGRDMGEALRGRSITPEQTTGLYTDLYNAGEMQVRAPAGEAYREVAESLVGQNGKPITDLQQLSLSLKGMKEAPIVPKPGQAAGRVIGAQDMTQALGSAEAGLGEIAPQFKNANDAFRAYMQGPHKEMTSGPIGSLADKTIANANQQSPFGRLNSLMTGNSPSAIRETGEALNPAGPMAGVDTRVDPNQIARALVQQMLRKGATNPGATLRGPPGSMAEDQFSALLQGRTPGQVAQTLAPLATADRLQGFAGAAGVNELPRMSWTNAIRPFRTADMFMAGKHERDIAKEVSALLADPANIPQLLQIAKINPTVRKALMATGAVMPQVANTQE